MCAAAPEKRIALFPNPSNGIFKLQIGDAYGGSDAHAEIINAQGEIVWSMRSPGRQEMIDLSGVPAGVYILKLHSEQLSAIRKLVIK